VVLHLFEKEKRIPYYVGLWHQNYDPFAAIFIGHFSTEKI